MENLDHINRKDDEMRHILQAPLEGNDAWAQPGERVWDGIAASLPDKKRRGGFWWWFGGLAAVALLGIFSLQKWGNTDVVQGANTALASPVSPSTEQLVATENSDASDLNNRIHPQEESAKTEVIPSTDDLLPTSDLHQSAKKRDVSKEKRDASEIIPPSNGIPPVRSGEAFIRPLPEKEVEEELRAETIVPNDSRPPVHFLPGLAWPSNEIYTKADIDISALNNLPVVQQPPTTVQKVPSKSAHRLLVYAQGFGADRQIQRKTNINLFDPEFGHKNWQYRMGVGYEWQHKSGFFIGSGLEYQDFHEEVEKEKKWVYTKSNATQVGTDTYQQNIPIVINTGFGTTSTTLRVDIEESSAATDYQEGDQVSFRLTVDHSLKWLRVPVYLGYHYEWRKWFAEIRGGMGLQLFLASNSTITEALEARDKIKIRETESTKQLKHLRKTIWDAQGGLYAGYRFSNAWSASLGYEQWFSLQSVVDRPNVSTIINGSGVQLALRRTF